MSSSSTCTYATAAAGQRSNRSCADTRRPSSCCPRGTEDRRIAVRGGSPRRRRAGRPTQACAMDTGTGNGVAPQRAPASVGSPCFATPAGDRQKPPATTRRPAAADCLSSPSPHQPGDPARWRYSWPGSPGCPPPVLVVQHLHPDFTGGLARLDAAGLGPARGDGRARTKSCAPDASTSPREASICAWAPTGVWNFATGPRACTGPPPTSCSTPSLSSVRRGSA